MLYCIKTIEKYLAIIVENYITEQMILVLIFLGIGLLLLSLFLPRKIQFHKIDLKRILNKNTPNIGMSKTVRYFHTLSKSSIFKLFPIEEDSKRYKKYEKLIRNLDGLNGCTPDVINMFKWLIFLGIMLLSTIFIFLLSIVSSPSNSMGIFIVSLSISFLGFFLPEIYLKNRITKRKKEYLKELDTIELFTIIYLRANYNVYDLLVAITDVTTVSNKYFRECVNEFYINQEKALQNLADKIDIEEYQLLVDILKQATRVSGNNMIEFVQDHMKQLKKVHDLSIEEENKRRPLKYVFILALPLIGVIILWFYPLMSEAMSLFSEISSI